MLLNEGIVAFAELLSESVQFLGRLVGGLGAKQGADDPPHSDQFLDPLRLVRGEIVNQLRVSGLGLVDIPIVPDIIIEILEVRLLGDHIENVDFRRDRSRAVNRSRKLIDGFGQLCCEIILPCDLCSRPSILVVSDRHTPDYPVGICNEEIVDRNRVIMSPGGPVIFHGRHGFR